MTNDDNLESSLPTSSLLVFRRKILCDAKPKPVSRKCLSNRGSLMMVGGGNYQMQIVTKLPNENIQNYQLQMIDSGWGGGVNYQMQIVTKLPNENIQNYQLQRLILGGEGKLPNANCDQTTKWYH